MRASVASVIICDDVRKEQNGKDILIGVYGGGVVIQSYPALLRLAFWIEIDPDSVGNIHCQLRIEPPSGNPPVLVGFDLAVTIVEAAVFVMGGVPLALERDGEIVVSAKIGQEDWKVVKRKNVARAPASNPPLNS